MPRVMKVQVIRDFVDVAARSQQLGCRIPVRVALLPSNFAAATNAGEFRFHAATPYIRSAWKSVGLEDEGPGSELGISAGNDRNSPGIPDRVPSGSTAAEPGIRDSVLGAGSGIPTPAPSPSAEIPLVAFFGTSLLSGPEWCPTVALSLVTRVLVLHPACASPWEVRFHAVVERPGTHGCTCIEYQGDAYGIVDLCTDVRRVLADR